MKKSLIALAVLATAGVASAQSSVTLFGIVDVNLQIGRGSIADRTQITDSGYSSSRLGFRGTEDLGGGMSASFWLEAGINPDNGTGDATNTNNQAPNSTGNGLTFNRRSTVSLAGGWGEVRLGRDYVPQFWNVTVFDPFGTNGVGANQMSGPSLAGVTGVRASNSIAYFLPGKLGGFYGQAMYYLGENLQNGAATEKDGRGFGLRAGFANGPFNVAVAYGKTEYSVGDAKQANIGGEWNFGMAKLMGQYSRDKNAGVTGKGGLIGALVPVGAGEIRVAVSRYKVEGPSTTKLALGYVHNLSKRTALYTTIARVKNKNGAAVGLGGAVASVNGSSTGFDLGVRHSF